MNRPGTSRLVPLDSDLSNCANRVSRVESQSAGPIASFAGPSLLKV